MNLEAFLEHLNSGKPVQGGSEAHRFMHGVSQEALRITAEINGSYHTPEELRTLFSQLIGRPVDESFALFPPFHTDCGKNMRMFRDKMLQLTIRKIKRTGAHEGKWTYKKTVMDRMSKMKK